MEGTTPVLERRKLRERKPPPPTPLADQFDSDDQTRGRNKRRKTNSRSVKKIVQTQAKAAAKSTPKAKGKSAKANNNNNNNNNNNKKKQARSIVRGDTGDVDVDLDEGEEPIDEEDLQEEAAAAETKKPKERILIKKISDASHAATELVGEPIDEALAKKKWPHRYRSKQTGSISLGQTPEDLRARKHYSSSKVDGVMFELNDDAYVKADDGIPDYICRIVEIFEGVDSKPYFTAQWFFRAEDTVIKQCADKQDKRRLFLSGDKNDNPLECIGSKLKIVYVEPNIDLLAKEAAIPECDYYYDMSYDVAYSTFQNLSPEIDVLKEVSTSAVVSKSISNKASSDSEPLSLEKKTLHLLDLYSGCGGMSTGLCLGAALSGINLETTWAVDLNHHACDSLQRNHPRTQVRNEKAENFLTLLKEWAKLVDEYNVQNEHTVDTSGDLEDSDNDDDDDGHKLPKGVFEVDKLVNICYGDPNNLGKVGIMFLVRWKGYSSENDSWEPIDGLGDAREKVKEFIVNGYKRNILPLPGTVDVICGGPPCQGISGFNRFRNVVNPFDDEKNLQMAVFMEIVDYLKPKFVLMENVVDILKFSKGFLGRYALGRLVEMNYQVRLGLMVAGCYGLPQFRMRAFLFGALPTEVLPQFPLPTHNVVNRGVVPQEFVLSVVALDENVDRSILKPELFLGEAISDLPAVKNDESREEMPYGEEPGNEFQQFIRLSRKEMLDHSFGDEEQEQNLLDHQPLKLNEDDYARVCQIPKRKGANFRDLEGVLVGPDNKCYLNKAIPRPLLPSGRFLVPDYCISHLSGKSVKYDFFISSHISVIKWDETVPTVVTRAEPHNQVILHPSQDRVLTIRENARLQGFPDYYKFSGPHKQRYMQVGNAVAVPVGRALGYSLGHAIQKIVSDGPLCSLPSNFFYPSQAVQGNSSSSSGLE